jgi:hypothetical protein
MDWWKFNVNFLSATNLSPPSYPSPFFCPRCASTVGLCICIFRRCLDHSRNVTHRLQNTHTVNPKLLHMRDSEHKYNYIIYSTTKNNKLTHENSKLTIPRIKFHQIPVSRGKCPKGFFFNFLFCTMTNNVQLFHKLSHSYMFRHYRVSLSELVTNALPCQYFKCSCW